MRFEPLLLIDYRTGLVHSSCSTTLQTVNKVFQFQYNCCLCLFPSAELNVVIASILWYCWLGDRKGILFVKTSASKHLEMTVNVIGCGILLA